MLAGPRWRRTSRGLYVPATAVPSTTTQRLVEAAALLPAGGALGGWAAACAWGADLLDGRDDHTLREQPVLLFLPPGQHRPALPGVRYGQQRLRPVEIATRSGLVLTTPSRTASDLVHDAPDLTEAVVALDALLGAGLVEVADLVATPGRRGARQARQACELARAGVRSTWETRLRLLYVLELGLPAPLVNRAVHDGDGRFLGVPDLLDVEAGLVLEYDGARWTGPGSRVVGGHRDRDQHRADNVREELFERAGLVVVRVDAVDMRRYRRRLLARIDAARADGLRRDRRRDRWVLASRRSDRSSRAGDRESLLLDRPRLSP